MMRYDDVGGEAGAAEVLSTEIGEVRLERLVSRSPAIVVFEARTIVDAQRLAVKCYADPRLRDREERALKQLVGAPVPRVLGRTQVGAREALLLEWIEGVMLLDRQNPIYAGEDPDALRTVLVRLADTLGAIHQEGVVHSDLKPDHVIVTPDQSVRLIDFSAAQFTDQPSDGPLHLTPEMAAPEQSDGASLDPSTDIHGFGTILFWLLSGHLPRTEDARIPAEPSDSSAMTLARKCLSERADDRPASAADLRAELLLVDLPTSRPDAAESFPDTVQMRERLPGSLPPVPEAVMAAQSREPAWRVLRVALWLIFAAALAVPAGWYGLIFYERYYKKDWVVDPSGMGDALSVAEVFVRGGDDLAIQLSSGRHVLPDIAERRVSILPTPTAETPPVIVSQDGGCTTLARSTVRLSGLTFDAIDVPENGVCIDITGGMVTLSDIRIENTGGAGLRARRGAGVEITDLLVDGADADGLRFSGGADVFADRVTIRSVAGIGLRAVGGAEVEAQELSISETGGAGLAAGGGALVTVAGGLVEKTAGSAVDAMDGAAIALSDVRVREAKGVGIALYDGARLAARRSQIAENALSGLFADGAAAIALDDVGIEKNGEHGAVLLSLREGFFRSVTIRENKGAGLAIFPEAALELSETEVTENAGGDILDGRAKEPSVPADDEARPSE